VVVVAAVSAAGIRNEFPCPRVLSEPGAET
jgi:hypothetical protein